MEDGPASISRQVVAAGADQTALRVPITPCGDAGHPPGIEYGSGQKNGRSANAEPLSFPPVQNGDIASQCPLALIAMERWSMTDSHDSIRSSNRMVEAFRFRIQRYKNDSRTRQVRETSAKCLGTAVDIVTT